MFRVLIVEDNEMNRDMLARRLARRGYEISLAADGIEAIAQARSVVPDIVLMDMSLPRMDGWEATRLLKNDPSIRPMPVIALTAHAMADDRRRAMEAGCDDYETKPIDMPRLLSKISALLSPAPQSTRGESRSC